MKKVDQRKKNCICKPQKSQITPSQGQGHLVFPGDKRYTVQGDKKRPSLLPPFLQLSGPAPLLLHIRGKISQANARPTCPRVPCSLPMCRVSTYTGRSGMPTGKPCPNGLLFSIMLWSGIYCSGKPCANGDRADACPPT